MKRICILALVLLTGCGSTYRVRRSDLAAAAVIPAVREDGSPTWLDTQAIRSVEPGSSSEELVVHTSDRKSTLLAIGATVTGFGLATLMAGANARSVYLDSGSNQGKSINGLIGMFIGGTLALLGGGILLGGALTSSPEREPSPALLALPPERAR